jgi:hypothetical protein
MEAKRPWWKKKRWWALATALLIFAYPSSTGPIAYSTARGWISTELSNAYF